MSQSRRLAAIMFADIVGYTAMMQQDEAQGMKRAGLFRKVLEKNVGDHSGTILDIRGDGALCIFDSAVEAVRCAKSIQQSLNGKVPLRIGIHLGDIVLKEGHIYGDGVNIASRVESMGVPGSVLFTERIIHDLKSHPEFEVEELGDFKFKNVAEPLLVYALSNEGLSLPSMDDMSGKGERISKPNGKTLKILLAGVLGILLIYAGFSFWQGFGSIKGTAEGTSYNRIAVLPFENIGPDEKNEYFSDGMTDELISKLSKISQFRLIARSSSMSYKGTHKSAGDIGKELAVDHLLEGSVRKEGNRLRISVKLIKTETQIQVWGEQFDKEWTDVFAIQDSIALAVSRSLREELLGKEKRELTEHPTENLAAYNLYMQGRFYWNQRSPEGLEKSIQYFEQALEKDPTYALAFNGLADAYTMQGFWSIKAPFESYPIAKEYIEKALAIDPNLAESLSTRGFIATVFDWEWKRAESDFTRALALNPSYSIAHQWFAEYLVIQGRFEEALAEIDKAQELDPLSQIITSVKGEFLRYTGKLAEAFDQYERSLSFNPEFGISYTHRTAAQVTSGRLDLALQDAKKGAELSHDATYAIGLLAYVHALRGEVKEAEEILHTLISRAEEDQVGHMYVVIVYAALEKEHKALEWLDKAFENRSSIFWFLWRSGILKDFEEHPRFQSLLKKGGFL